MSRGKDRIIPSEVEENYIKEKKKFTSRSEWKSFVKSENRLVDVARANVLPFDYKFNAVHWAVDVTGLCREAIYSFCLMNAFAIDYKRKNKPGKKLSDVDWHVEYFASNCITRVDSCRDKLALMVWSFYCPFNPDNKDEVLTYSQILDRLKFPVNYDLKKLKGHKAFIPYLELLRGQEFKLIKTFRDLKTHRREPRIEIYGVEPHHGWAYMVPLCNPNEIAKWKAELKKQYPTNWFRETRERSCYIDGVLYNRRNIKDQILSYSRVKKSSEKCVISLLKASDGCLKILLRRKPLRGRKKR